MLVTFWLEQPGVAHLGYLLSEEFLLPLAHREGARSSCLGENREGAWLRSDYFSFTLRKGVHSGLEKLTE